MWCHSGKKHFLFKCEKFLVCILSFLRYAGLKISSVCTHSLPAVYLEYILFEFAYLNSDYLNKPICAPVNIYINFTHHPCLNQMMCYFEIGHSKYLSFSLSDSRSCYRFNIFLYSWSFWPWWILSAYIVTFSLLE